MKSVQFRMPDAKTVLYAIDMSFAGVFQDSARQRVVRTSADRLFFNRDTTDLTNSFAGFVQIFLNETATSLKSPTLVSYPVDVLFLNYRKDYVMKLI